MSDAVVAQIKRKITEAEAAEASMLSQIHEVRGRISGLRQALALIQDKGDERDEERSRDEVRDKPQRVRGSRLPNPETNPRWRFMLNLVNSAPIDGISVDHIVKETTRAGHVLPSNVARSFLSVAAQEGLIHRVSVGRYRGKNSNGPDAEASGPSSESSGDAGLPGELPRQDLPDGSTPSSSTEPLFRTAMR